MDAFQKEVDERTNLTASNKFELLLFHLGLPMDAMDGAPELFGINVFKVREIVPMVPVTRAAGTQSPMLGMVNIRGQVMSVVDLAAVAGCVPREKLNILLITEFARHTQAFAVESVEEIIRLDWAQVLPAETAMGSNVVTSIARLDSQDGSGRLVQVLDVEHILDLVSPVKDKFGQLQGGLPAIELLPGAVVVAADDSKVARALIEQCLSDLHVPFVMTNNGREALAKVRELASVAKLEGKNVSEKVALLLTDLEMPEMDGFTLTRQIKASEQLKSIPVVIHSSLTGNANEDHVKAVGANGYVAKFSPSELAAMLRKILSH
jgi:two-component system chemotaxis response regulator CheV